MLCAIYGLALLVALDYFGLHILWITVGGLAVCYMLHFGSELLTTKVSPIHSLFSELVGLFSVIVAYQSVITATAFILLSLPKFIKFIVSLELFCIGGITPTLAFTGLKPDRFWVTQKGVQLVHL